MNAYKNARLLEIYTVLSYAGLIIPVLVPYYRDKMGLSFQDFLIGEACFAATVVLLEIPSGWISDVWRRTHVMRLGAFAGLVGYTLLLVGDNLWWAIDHVGQHPRVFAGVVQHILGHVGDGLGLALQQLLIALLGFGRKLATALGKGGRRAQRQQRRENRKHFHPCSHGPPPARPIGWAPRASGMPSCSTITAVCTASVSAMRSSSS